MRATRRLAFIFLSALFLFSSAAQQAPTPAPQDPQAVSIVNQALNAAGGISAISAVKDYTATGNVTYHMVRGSGLSYLRIDAALPTGVHSEAINAGQITLKTKLNARRRMATRNLM